MGELTAAGVAVYALSYDEADALLDFSTAHGITYPLLSDPQSEVIRSFGILNTLIAADDHPWFGIPYPGTFVLDRDGKITHKFFDNNLAVRAGPEQLLRAVQGDLALESPEPETVATTVAVSVALDGSALAPTVLRDLVVRLSVPTGRHLYAEPAPQGTVAVDVRLDDNERLVARPLQRPVSESHKLAGTDEVFGVHHGVFELRVPLTVNSAAALDASVVTVAGEICWQSCDDEVCDIPARERFELELPVARAPAMALFADRANDLEPNAKAHFRKMSQRRSDS